MVIRTDEEKRLERIRKNRESARRSIEVKRLRMKKLEEENKKLMIENAELKQRLLDFEKKTLESKLEEEVRSTSRQAVESVFHYSSSSSDSASHESYKYSLKDNEQNHSLARISSVHNFLPWQVPL